MIAMDSAKLLARCQAGDELAVEQLVREYQPRLFRLALSILDDGSGLGSADAEEVAQDTFLRALRSLDTFRGESSLATWLYSITINLCRNVLRSRRRREHLQRLFQALVEFGEDHSHTTEERVVHHEATDRVLKAVFALNEKHRLPVILRYYHACSVREIAQILDVPEGTVHSRLNTARSQLKIRLEEEWTEDRNL
jgi:RNA polymerase sigma-70 factor, ECF subfamily